MTGWYGKIWHFWETDKKERGEEGGDFPWGEPKLMGSLTERRQLDVDVAMEERDRVMEVSTRAKREGRKGLRVAEPDERADQWWREAEREGRGIYARS